MTEEDLRKKFVRDIMFSSSMFSRVNVSIVSKNNIDEGYFMLNKNEGDNIKSYEIEKDDFNLNFKYEGHTIKGKFSFHIAPGNLVKTHIPKLEIDDDKAIFVQVFKSDGNIIFPLVYKVEVNPVIDASTIKPKDVFDDFLEGGDLFEYKQVMNPVEITVVENGVVQPYELAGPAAEMNEDFNFMNAAEFFVVHDIVDDFTNGHKKKLSWNPFTKILSVSTTNKKENLISVDLFYIENIDEVIENCGNDDYKPCKFFSYEICTDNPTINFINLKDGEFDKNDHIEVKYDTADMGVITDFKYYLDGELMVHTYIDGYEEGAKVNILKIDYKESKETVFVHCQNTGSYYATNLSFVYNDDIFTVPKMKSYVYTFDNMYMRSIAYNAIKVL
jgi:hypothetical protein